jgi:hypothetical protein
MTDDGVVNGLDRLKSVVDSFTCFWQHVIFTNELLANEQSHSSITSALVNTFLRYFDYDTINYISPNYISR